MTPTESPAPPAAHTGRFVFKGDAAPDIFAHSNNDMGRAQAFLDREKDNLLWVAKIKKWLVWNCSKWDYDDPPTQVGEKARELALAALEQAKDARREFELLHGGKPDTNPEKIKELARVNKLYERAVAFGNLKAMTNIMELVKFHSANVVSPDELDKDPWVAGVKNGVLNLKTGELVEMSKELMITKHLGCNYEPAARCPTWEKFLWVVLQGKQDLIDYVQEAIGYTLTGLMMEQNFWFLYGQGRNGKSKFIETLLALSGDYSKKAPDNLLAVPKNQKEPSREISQIPGYRLLVGNEFSQSVKLNESIVKAISGGDSMNGIPLYGHDFQFQPVAKLWMFGNHKPVISGTDEGIWRRVLLVPFTYQIPPEDQDGEMGDKLKRELSGILNWALVGLRRWQGRGCKLQAPEEIRIMVEKYREDEDVLGEFIAECITFTPGKDTLKRCVYSAYQRWCELNGVRMPATNRKLSRDLKERPEGLWVDDEGKHWRGVTLNPEEAMEVGGTAK